MLGTAEGHWTRLLRSAFDNEARAKISFFIDSLNTRIGTISSGETLEAFLVPWVKGTDVASLCFIRTSAQLSADLFPAVSAFARVAYHASFKCAASELGVPTSALSQTRRTLETRLGMRLLHRSIRKVRLTEAAQRFLLDMEPAIAALVTALDSVAESRERPVGVLRLNLSNSSADVLVMPHLGKRSGKSPLTRACGGTTQSGRWSAGNSSRPQY